MTTIDLTSPVYHIEVSGGRTFDHDLTYEGIDLTGYSGTFTVTSWRRAENAAVFRLATGGSGVTITGGTAASTVNLLKSAAEMGTLAPGTYWHELELASGGTVDPSICLAGRFVVAPEVSR